VLLLIECVLVTCEIALNLKEARVEAAAVGNLSEEFRATITNVGSGTISLTTEKGFDKTLPVADNVKVFKGKVDSDTKEVSAGEPIAGGLQDDAFKKAVAQGTRVSMLTDTENKQIAAIYLLPTAQPSGKRGK